jgi:hypothetical protein
MAKQKKALPARKPPARSRVEESLSLRTAESLGRVIGSLQRQLDSAIDRFGHSAKLTPRLPRTSDGTSRTSRHSVKRSRRTAGEDMASMGRASVLDKKKARASANGVARTVAKRASRPK